MAELERPGVPGVECRGEPDIEAEIGLEVTLKAGMGASSVLLVIRHDSYWKGHKALIVSP